MAAKRRSAKRAASPSNAGPNRNARNGRTKDGKFAKGNPGGPGNPIFRRLRELRAAVHDAITPDDIKSVLCEMRKIALGGNGISASDQIAAAKVLLERVLGKPQTPASEVEIPDIKSASDIPEAFRAVLNAAKSGGVSVEQVTELVKILDGHRTAFGERAMRQEIDELRAIVEERGAPR